MGRLIASHNRASLRNAHRTADGVAARIGSGTMGECKRNIAVVVVVAREGQRMGRIPTSSVEVHHGRLDACVNVRHCHES
jgi:hypothetical protein